MTTIKTVGIAGTGVIGAGWATRMLGHGLDVIAYDPVDGAEAGMRDKIERGWPHMLRLMEKDDVDPRQEPSPSRRTSRKWPKPLTGFRKQRLSAKT